MSNQENDNSFKDRIKGLIEKRTSKNPELSREELREKVDQFIAKHAGTDENVLTDEQIDQLIDEATQDAAQDPHNPESNPVGPETDVQHEEPTKEHKENVVSPEPLKDGPDFGPGPGADEDLTNPSKADQHLYDIDRDADEDALKAQAQRDEEAEKAEKEKHSRKPNDIRESENVSHTQKEISHSSLAHFERHPHIVHRVIGNNEYFLVTDRQLKYDFPEIVQDEVKKLHDGQRYEVDGENFIAVPRNTVNTPQPFRGAAAGISKESHNDIFARNVELDKQRSGRE
jgi:hypothetical protein